jgi:hypothetical protein
MTAQHLAKVLVRLFERLQQAAVQFVVGAGAVLARHFHAGDRGERFDRCDEIQPIVFHQEGQRRACSAATEAVIELLLRVHAERRSLLVVKRTQCLKVATGLTQRYARVDHVDDVDTRQQIVDEGLWDPAGHAAVYLSRSIRSQIGASTEGLGRREQCLNAGADNGHVGATLQTPA